MGDPNPFVLACPLGYPLSLWPAVISSVLPSPATLALNPVTSQIALGHSLGTFGQISVYSVPVN